MCQRLHCGLIVCFDRRESLLNYRRLIIGSEEGKNVISTLIYPEMNHAAIHYLATCLSPSFSVSFSYCEVCHLK